MLLFLLLLLCWLQDFRGVIKRCKSVILVAQAMPELASDCAAPGLTRGGVPSATAEISLRGGAWSQ